MEKNKFLDLEYQKDKFLKEINFFDKQEKEVILKALKLAEEAHRGQERDGGIPYIIHPIRAALNLIKRAQVREKDLICALLLHDVLEDTELEEETIKDELGERILSLVKAATRSRGESETEKEKAQSKIDKIRKVSNSSKETRLIKLCDRLDNRYSQDFLPEGHPSRKKFPRWNREFKLYLPIAKKTNSYLFDIFKKFSRN